VYKGPQQFNAWNGTSLMGSCSLSLRLSCTWSGHDLRGVCCYNLSAFLVLNKKFSLIHDTCIFNCGTNVKKTLRNTIVTTYLETLIVSFVKKVQKKIKCNNSYLPFQMFLKIKLLFDFIVLKLQGPAKWTWHIWRLNKKAKKQKLVFIFEKYIL